MTVWMLTAAGIEKSTSGTTKALLAGLPWMCTDALNAVLDRPLVLVLEGEGGGTWTLSPASPASDGRPVVSEGAVADAAATARSSAHDFVAWGTQRRPWRDFVKLEGDADFAAPVLDACNVI